MSGSEDLKGSFQPHGAEASAHNSSGATGSPAARAPEADQRQTRSSSKSPAVTGASQTEKKPSPTSGSNKTKKSSKPSSELRAQILASRANKKKNGQDAPVMIKDHLQEVTIGCSWSILKADRTIRKLFI